MQLGKPFGVFAEQQGPEDRQIDVEHRRCGHQRPVAGHQFGGEAEVHGEGRQLLVGGDLRAAADGVEQPVLLRCVTDQQVHVPGRAGSQSGEGIGGQDVAVEDRGVERRIIVARTGGGVAPVGVNHLVGGSHQHLWRR